MIPVLGSAIRLWKTYVCFCSLEDVYCFEQWYCCNEDKKFFNYCILVNIIYCYSTALTNTKCTKDYVRGSFNRKGVTLHVESK